MPAAPPQDDLDDFFWSDLLDYLDEGRVLPIVDSGAFVVDGPDGPVTYEALVARRLAERLRLPIDGAARLDEVVSRFQRQSPGGKAVLYGRTLQITKELDIAPPQGLLDLAAILPFRLFVSVSFDTLLQRGIDQVRHQGEARTDVIAYAPNRTADLPAPAVQLLRPTVFHLMGRLSTAAGESVICDEDRLEFLHALQEDALRPKLLFDELRDSHLLLLGCRLPDWAARFFLRTAKDSRLSMRERETFEYVVDAELAADRGLAAFVADFSRPTRLVALSPEDFLAELKRRWQARHPGDAAPAAPAPARGEPQDGAVFISYSRADTASTRRLAQVLDAAGIDVWFDQNELEAGDAWELKILRGIKRCALFIAVVSQDTQREERRRSFFWREWNAANEQAAGMAPDEPFILPVAIDGIEPYRAHVPGRFDEKNWSLLPGGEPSAGFVDKVRQLQRGFRERTRS